ATTLNDCLVFENINICDNSLTGSSTAGINAFTLLNSNFIRCNINDNSGTNFAGILFQNCANIECIECTAKANSSGSAVQGFEVNSSTAIVFKSCIVDANSGTTAANGFLIG